MVDLDKYQLFNTSGVDKQIRIEISENTVPVVVQKTLTNSDIHFQQFELTESICSQNELRFGGCESTCIKFRVNDNHEENNVYPIKGKRLQVYLTLNRTKTVNIGTYIVDSDKATADKKHRDIVAYDRMQSIINAENVADWYNNFPYYSDKTVKNVRTYFCNRCGVVQENVELPNDDFDIPFDVSDTMLKISGIDIISSIAEINGCFAKFGRDNVLHYIFLNPKLQMIYPSSFTFPSNKIFPGQYTNRITQSHYKNCTYEDFKTKKITRIQLIRDGEEISSTSGVIYPNPETPISDSDNVYRITNNLILRNATNEKALPVLANMFEKIKDIEYIPFQADCQGNLCYEAGDYIVIPTKYKEIRTYILNRVIKGIMSLSDTYSAKGIESYIKSDSGGYSSIQSGYSSLDNDEIAKLKNELKKVKQELEQIKETLNI